MWFDFWPDKIKAALQICKVPYSKDFRVFRIDEDSFEIDFGGFPIKYNGNITPKEEALRNVLQKYVSINRYGVSSAVITLSDRDDDWIPAPEDKKPKREPIINENW